MSNNRHNAPTRLIRSKKTRLVGEQVGEAQETELIKNDDLSNNKPTEKIPPVDSKKSEQQSQSNTPSDRNKTRIFRGSSANRADKGDEQSNPVTGWLVVIDGPGKGQSKVLGYGAQRIGRNKNQDICLDYGDEEISRERHAGIVYDPKGRKFYLQPGEGTNLVYLDDSPVLSPTELTQGSHIQLGSTTLRFVAFCGADFDWN